MYIFPNKSGDMVFEFNNLKELRAAVQAVKRLPELDHIYDEPVPQPAPWADPKHDVYHTLTGEAAELIWAVNNAFADWKRETFEVQLYTYHGAPMKWQDRKILGLPALSELKKKFFRF